MEPKWVPGAIWGRKGPREAKGCQKWSGFGLDSSPFGLHFGTWRHLFRRHFFMFFLEVSFSLPGRLLGAKGAQKAPQMEPKWSPKGAWGYPLGSEKTMVFIVREAYGEVSGRLWEATFSRLRLQTLSGGVLGSILADFMRFWVPFEAPFGVHLGPKGPSKSRSKIRSK